MVKLLGVILLALALTGCGTHYTNLIDGLNERQVQSCLDYNGTASLGFGPGAGQGGLHGITVTGGAPLADCKEILN